jgi:preprotein translocase subunit SecA
MEDELMRLFGGDRLKSMMQRLNVPEDMPLENKMVSRSIESAQKKVEGRNFDIRRHVVQYDDVMNKHRDIMYKRRQKLLKKIAGKAESADTEALHDEVIAMMKRECEALAQEHAAGEDPEMWDMKKLRESLGALHPDLERAVGETELKTLTETDEVRKLLEEMMLSFYEGKLKHFGKELTDKAEQIVVLQSIDSHWMDHIDSMAHLREQVAFSGYAQRDPLIEYQDQGFRMFQKLLVTIAQTTVRTLLQIDFAQFAAPQIQTDEQDNLQTNAAEIEGALQTLGAAPTQKAAPKKQMPATSSDIGRNDPCPCGSGKKYKKCHGKDA